jgi:hypothetical protein
MTTVSPQKAAAKTRRTAMPMTTNTVTSNTKERAIQSKALPANEGSSNQAIPTGIGNVSTAPDVMARASQETSSSKIADHHISHQDDIRNQANPEDRTNQQPVKSYLGNLVQHEVGNRGGQVGIGNGAILAGIGNEAILAGVGNRAVEAGIGNEAMVAGITQSRDVDEPIWPLMESQIEWEGSSSLGQLGTSIPHLEARHGPQLTSGNTSGISGDHLSLITQSQRDLLIPLGVPVGPPINGPNDGPPQYTIRTSFLQDVSAGYLQTAESDRNCRNEGSNIPIDPALLDDNEPGNSTQRIFNKGNIPLAS